MDVPSAPIITVQPPDTGGRKGSSRGGAGKLNAVCADARSQTTAIALDAASNAAKKISGRAPPATAETGFGGKFHLTGL